MYYVLRITEGRKVVFSLRVNSMDDAFKWISKFESNPIYTYRIIPKQSYKKEPIVRQHSSELEAHRGV